MASQLCAEMRQDVMHILKESNDGAGQASEDVRLAQRMLLGKLVQLRAENRILWQESRLAKVNTAEAKANIDRLNLELQGLYYEQRHLKNEIKACQETPTRYDHVPLIDQSQYLEAHPEAVSLSPRELMHARLRHEKEERLNLENIRKELSAKKASLIAENKKRKGDLENLEKQLTNFIASAESISTTFKKR